MNKKIAIVALMLTTLIARGILNRNYNPLLDQLKNKKAKLEKKLQDTKTKLTKERTALIASNKALQYEINTVKGKPSQDLVIGANTALKNVLLEAITKVKPPIAKQTNAILNDVSNRYNVIMAKKIEQKEDLCKINLCKLKIDLNNTRIQKIDKIIIKMETEIKAKIESIDEQYNKIKNAKRYNLDNRIKQLKNEKSKLEKQLEAKISDAMKSDNEAKTQLANLATQKQKITADINNINKEMKTAQATLRTNRNNLTKEAQAMQKEEDKLEEQNILLWLSPLAHKLSGIEHKLKDKIYEHRQVLRKRAKMEIESQHEKILALATQEVTQQCKLKQNDSKKRYLEKQRAKKETQLKSIKKVKSDEILAVTRERLNELQKKQATMTDAIKGTEKEAKGQTKATIKAKQEIEAKLRPKINEVREEIKKLLKEKK